MTNISRLHMGTCGRRWSVTCGISKKILPVGWPQDLGSIFDAVAVILSDEGARALSMASAAIDFVRDAFCHLKAIAVDEGGQALLNSANVGQGAGAVDTNAKDAFIAAAKTRQGDQKKSVRTLA